VDGWTGIREAETLRAGELLFALGHPLGVRDSLAMGVLHDVARDRRTGAPRWIVADIRLAPGIRAVRSSTPTDDSLASTAWWSTDSASPCRPSWRDNSSIACWPSAPRSRVPA